MFLLLWKHLLIFKVLPVTLFKELVAAFRNPPVSVELASEPGCDSKNCSVKRPWHLPLHKPRFPAPNGGGLSYACPEVPCYCYQRRVSPIPVIPAVLRPLLSGLLRSPRSAPPPASKVWRGSLRNVDWNAHGGQADASSHNNSTNWISAKIK